MNHQRSYFGVLQHDRFQPAPVTAAVMLVFLSGHLCAQTLSAEADTDVNVEPVQLAAVEFNEQFLVGAGAQKVDISRFNQGNAALPGQYRTTLYVNQVLSGTVDITLRDIDGDQNNVQPVFNRELLERMHVDFTRLNDDANAKIDALGQDGNDLLPALIDGTRATFDPGEQRLNVSIPQAILSRNARGWVDPKFWDDGIPAATLQYNANVYHTNGDGSSNTQGYLGLTAGINAGPWRLRYNGNVNYDADNGTDIQHIQTYLQRSFSSINSQLTLGDSYTDGNIFDSYGIRGVQLATDDRMYPESQRGFAPTVRGIASSNAKVQIKQSGNIIYETTVSPGPFEINDLYATGYGGDLQLVVTEADGRQHISSIPYAAPVNALREGRWRYGIVAGQYRSTSVADTPFVLQATIQHGLNNLFTLYGGIIAAEHYQSGAAGVALNTSIGAFGLDITHASTQLRDQPDRSGQSIRLSYARLFSPTNTNVTLAAYRYSTSGFLSLQDALSLRDQEERHITFNHVMTQKGRLQVTLNQGLGKWGSIYLSGYTQNYWNKPGRDTSYQFGYNTTVGRTSVNLSATRELNTDSKRWNNLYMLTVSIPLGKGSRIINSSTSFTHNTRDKSNQVQETLSGALGKDYEFNYGLTAAYNDSQGNRSSSVSANAGYLTPVTQVRVNASHSDNYTQVGGSLSGSVVAWPGGVALTSQTGDTFAVIDATDAAGARIASAPGARVDYFGHAVVAGMSPFEMNNIEIDPKGLPLGVELKSTEQRFAPTAGAVVKVKFETINRGKPTMLRIKQVNGDAVPFGADVLDAAGNSVGSVTQGGRVLAYIKSRTGDLTVKWGGTADQLCTVHDIAPATPKTGQSLYTFREAECRKQQQPQLTGTVGVL